MVAKKNSTIRLTSIVLLLLRILSGLHALRDNVSAYAHQGIEKHGNAISLREEDILSDLTNVGAATRKVALGGRKMAGEHKLNDEVVNKVKMSLEPKIPNEKDGYSQRVVLEDAVNNEMVTLMHKDYEGTFKPRHKIPINN